MNACISVIQHIRKLRGGAQFTASAGVRWCPLPLQVIEQSSIHQSGPTLSKGRSSVFFCPLTDLGSGEKHETHLLGVVDFGFHGISERPLVQSKISDPRLGAAKRRF